MADYKVTDTQLTDIADAIREKGETSESLEFPADFVSAIQNISGGGGVSIPEYYTYLSNSGRFDFTATKATVCFVTGRASAGGTIEVTVPIMDGGRLTTVVSSIAIPAGGRSQTFVLPKNGRIRTTDAAYCNLLYMELE